MTQSDTMIKAVVTGHSRGLGAALAAEFLGRDIPVLGLSRGANRELAGSAKLSEVAIDLADTGAVVTWLADNALRGFLDGATTAVLVNNAGILQPVGPLHRQDVATVGRASSVNVGAALMLSAAFAQASDAPDRRILHISSGAGRNPYAGWSIYCATKAALDHHARSVAEDQTAGLRICSIAPGVLDTDMQAEVRGSPEELFPDRERFVEMKESGRLADPARTATALVDFLMSRQFGADPVTDLRR